MNSEMQGRIRHARRLGAVVLAGLLAMTIGCAKRQPQPQTEAGNMAVAAALAPTTPPIPGPTYRINAGDELHIHFLYQPDMSEQLPVRPDGRISLGATGEITALGLTPGELEKVIIERSSSRLRDPEVTVVVTKVGEQRVYVGGEVARPGFVALRPEMTPLQAVLQSGGFKKSAKLESVLLLTPGPDGAFSAARVDMEQVVNAGVPERVRLHPNDVVYVPPTWISDMNDVVDQYVRGLVPAFPRVGVGYSLSQ